MRYHVKPSKLQGEIRVPPSKSHTLRAILFASMATGKSIIHRYLSSPDTLAMIHACRQLGATITFDEQQIKVIGVAGKPHVPENIIDAGNSGQVLRFIGAVAALTSGYAVITGDESIRTNRPIQPLLNALSQLSTFAVSTQENGHAPIIIKGPLQGGTATLNGQDSQPVSGLLIACAFADKPTVINVENPGEKPWIDLTLDWFKRLGITCTHQNYTCYHLTGVAAYPGFEYTVPGDFSSAAFPLVAALITESEIVLHNLDMHDAQGDKALIFALQAMGAAIEIDNEKKIVSVKKSSSYFGKSIDVNNSIDALPILAVMGCFAAGATSIYNASIARQKESDRLSAITQELKKMGADIIEENDSLIVRTSELTAAKLESHADHRIAMALAIAALAAQGETIIENTDCVAKSFPHFAEVMKQLGALIEEHA